MTRPSPSPVPQWPTLTATVHSDGTGEVNLSPSIAEPITADTVEDARLRVLARVAAYALEKHGRAVRLQVRDPAGEWLLAVNPDGTVTALEPDLGPSAAARPHPPQGLVIQRRRPPTAPKRPRRPSSRWCR